MYLVDYFSRLALQAIEGLASAVRIRDNKSVTIVVPPPNAVVPVSTASLTVDIEGDTYNLPNGSTVELFIDGVSQGSQAIGVIYGDYAFTWNGGSIGTHTLTVVATDANTKRTYRASHTVRTKTVYSPTLSTGTTEADTTTNKNALQGAVNSAVANGGGVIYIPNGVHLIKPGTGAAVVNITGDGVVFWGASRTLSIIRIFPDTGNYGDTFLFTGDHVSDFGMVNFYFDQDPANNDPATVDCYNLPQADGHYQWILNGSAFGRRAWFHKMDFTFSGINGIVLQALGTAGNPYSGGDIVFNRLRADHVRARTDPAGLRSLPQKFDDISCLYTEVAGNVTVRQCAFTSLLTNGTVNYAEIHSGGPVLIRDNAFENADMGCIIEDPDSSAYVQHSAINAKVFGNNFEGVWLGLKIHAAGNTDETVDVSVYNNTFTAAARTTSRTYTSTYTGIASNSFAAFDSATDPTLIQLEWGGGAVYKRISITTNTLDCNNGTRLNDYDPGAGVERVDPVSTATYLAGAPDTYITGAATYPGAAIQMAGRGTIDEITITGNTINNSTDTGIHFGRLSASAPTTGPIKNITVKNNTIVDAQWVAIRIRDVSCTNVLVENNTITDNRRTDGSPGQPYGHWGIHANISAGNTNGVTIRNNTFNGLEGANLTNVYGDQVQVS